MDVRESSLLERWKKIDDLYESLDANADAEYSRMKEQWFCDGFNYLESLSENSHCFCQHRDVTWPLLEPFYEFFKHPEHSRIHGLWRRLTSEMKVCINCIIQYYQVKQYYKDEFVSSVVKPIMAVLQALDKKRVISYMKEIMQMKSGDGDSRQVLAILFEIFTFPELLEDAFVNDAMIPFLRHVSNTHDLRLARNQRYPGLCGLLFHSNQDVRMVALVLVKTLEPFRDAEELEPVQPVLEKRMKCLESAAATVVGMTQESLWLGLKTLLGLLCAPAIEEGIVERYPAFVSLVLNNVSENSSVFGNALCCLNLLLEVLGYKFWLKSAFSPGVLRNTLLSQCFHAKDEKTHKSVFGIFQNFLRSLEPMPDGQFERQRRYLLYFLLQQVPHSNNFSSLIRKHASQIACSIVSRSFKIEPSSPPFECAHFWGPTVISTVRDTDLHPPLRQPALELVEFLLVADAAALGALYCKSQGSADILVDVEIEDSGSFSWNSFVQQIEADCENWHCVPLTWIGALESSTLVLSSEFTKAFLWAASRISVLDHSIWPGGDGNHSQTVAAALNWEKPKGFDDGSDGKVCENAVKAAVNLEELISILKRSADAFTLKFQEHGRIADLLWDPTMSEALLLLLMDSSPGLRKFGKETLQLFSKDSRLESGLQYICESEKSLVYAINGFHHAVKLIGANPLKHCSSLQHIFFVALKFFNTGQAWAPHGCWKSCSQKLARILWSLLVTGMTQGQHCATVSGYETCCSRMFELLPVVFKFMIPTSGKELWKVSSEEDCPSWFQVLHSWSNTSFASIRRRWNEAIVSILEDLARGSNQAGSSKAVSNLLQPGSVIDSDQRERLLLLFSSASSTPAVFSSTPHAVFSSAPSAPKVVIQLDSDEDEEDVVYRNSKQQDTTTVIQNPVPSTQHKRPVRVRSIRNTNQSSFKDTATLQSKDREKNSYKEPLTQQKPAKEDGTSSKPREAALKSREPAPMFDVRTPELLNELVSEDGPDALDAALDNAKKLHTSIATTSVHPKRKLVRLDMPAEQLRASIPSRHRVRTQRRPPPPKIDDWLVRILGMDLFDSETTTTEADEFVKVPMRFTSAEHYVKVFRPLLLEEFKTQLHRSREEVDVEDKEKAGMVSLMSMERIDSLHLARFLSEAGKDGAPRACQENDLVLISRQPFRESFGGVHLLAKVERRERQNKGGGTIVLVKLYLPQSNDRLIKAKRLLVNRSRWHITRLSSITPQLREFQAVSAMAASPLLEVILSPNSSAVRTSSMPVALPEALWRTLTRDYNDSQLGAIKTSLGDRRGISHQISLVQGPPGTGKTRTIVAIVSVLLHTNDHSRKNRVLVCAQSNAAVDELLARLCKNGIYSSSGQFHKPIIVRSGSASSVHQDSMPYFIDKLVDNRLSDEKGKNSDDSPGDNAETTASLHSKLEQITEQISEVARRIAAGEDDALLKAKLNNMEKQKRGLTMDVQKAQYSSRKSFEADKIRRKQIKMDIILEADIVLTTLSGCGGDIYSACMESTDKGADVFFDAVVIDEAGQALEPATLIPLQLLATSTGRCVMVGDPKQLPATVLSQVANRLSYERSMFERFQSNGYFVTMLNIQYRMHPDIRKFPSLHFYDNNLVDGENLEKCREANFHKDKLFPPYAFLDVPHGQETAGESVANFEEVSVVVELFRSFKQRYPQEISPGCIGIITPYKRQLLVLKDTFKKNFGEKVLSNVEFNTIDGFQGREVDILILSTVRASSQGSSIGFVADIRRMNVALTRAKFSLWIVGNAKALVVNRAWAALLDDAATRGTVHEVRKPYSRYFDTPGNRNRNAESSGDKRSAEATTAMHVRNVRQKVGAVSTDPPRSADVVRKLASSQSDQKDQEGSGEKLTSSVQKLAGSNNANRFMGSKDAQQGAAELARQNKKNFEAIRSRRGDRSSQEARGIKILGAEEGAAELARQGSGKAMSSKVVEARRAVRDPDEQASNRNAEDRRQQQQPRGAEALSRTNGIDMNERRKQREEAAALLTGCLLDSRKPDPRRAARGSRK